MTLVPKLREALASQNPELRRQAVSKLSNEPSRVSLPYVLSALGDEDWRVRKEAVSATKLMVPETELLRGLVEALKKTENIGLRNAAVEALAGFGEDAVMALGAELPKLDTDARTLAAEVLGLTGHPKALEHLKPLFSDSDPNVVAAAVEAVARIGQTDFDAAVPLLREALSSPQRFVQLVALDGLNRLGVELEWELLSSFIQDPVLVPAARRAASRSAHREGGRFLVHALAEASSSAFGDLLRHVGEYVSSAEQNAATVSELILDLKPEVHERILAELNAPSAQRRRMALAVAKVLPAAIAAERIVMLLSDDEVAPEAQRAVAWLGDAALPALLRQARSGTPQNRAVCIQLLGNFSGPAEKKDLLSVVHAALSDEDDEVVAAAIEALGCVGDEETLTLLADLMVSGRVSLRQAMQAAFRQLCDRFPARARALAQGTSPLGERSLCAVSVMAVLPFGMVSDVEADLNFLTGALAHADIDVRKTALEALTKIQDERAVEAAAFALTDEELVVRLAAVRTLGGLKTPDGQAPGMQYLTELFRNASDRALLPSAIKALGDTGDPRALGLLCELVRGPDPLLAVAAVQSIARLAGVRQLEALIDAVSHSNTEVVKAALLALAPEHDLRVTAHIAACLDHPAWDVRRMAADLLGRRPGIGNLELLRAKLGQEDEPLVKDALRHAIAAMAGPGGRSSHGDFRSGGEG